MEKASKNLESRLPVFQAYVVHKQHKLPQCTPQTQEPKQSIPLTISQNCENVEITKPSVKPKLLPCKWWGKIT